MRLEFNFKQGTRYITILNVTSTSLLNRLIWAVALWMLPEQKLEVFQQKLQLEKIYHVWFQQLKVNFRILLTAVE